MAVLSRAQRMGRMEGKNKKNGEGKREEMVESGGGVVLELEGDTESASFDHLRKCWFLGVQFFVLIIFDCHSTMAHFTV